MMSPKKIALGALLFATSAALIHTTGCPANECEYDHNPKLAGEPVEGGIDCPPGLSCYLGQCFLTCNPGAERELCTTDNDCKNNERPHCISTDPLVPPFCSTCEEGQTCVVGLSICQPVAEIPDPEPPTGSMSPNVGLPLDGGTIDGSTFEDAGLDMPIAENVERTGYVALVAVKDYAMNGADSTFGDARFCDVRNAMQVQSATLHGLDKCELRTTRVYVGTSTPTDLGPVSFAPDPGSPGAMTISSGVNATYQSGVQRYLMNVPLPAHLLVYSLEPQSNRKYVDFKGSGNTDIANPWTGVNGGLLIVPYELIPNPDTLALLENPLEVSMTTPLDLAFSWEKLPGSVSTEDLGFDAEVTIGGERSPCGNNGAAIQKYYIKCTLNEKGLMENRTITVPAALLSEYIANVNPVQGDRVRVRFGRLHAESVNVESSKVVPNSMPPRREISLVDLYFGQELETEIIFRP